MAKKIDMVKSCAEACVILTVTHDNITTTAHRPTNGAAVVQAVYDACKEYGTTGSVIVQGGVWSVEAVFDGADIWVDHYLTCKGHYRRRNVDKARQTRR